MTSAQKKIDNLNRKAVSLLRDEEYTSAISVLFDVLALEPDNRQALQNLGLGFFWTGDIPSAERCFRAALEISPTHADCARYLLLTLESQGRFTEAVAFGRSWIARLETSTRGVEKLGELLEPGHDGPLLCNWSNRSRVETDALRKFKANFALSLMRSGDWSEGWRMYEYRTALEERVVPNRPAPHWNGQLVRGTGIVVYSEQGLGDTIMFGRFASLLAAQGASVFLMTQPKISKLMSTLPGVLEAVPYGHTVRANRLQHVPVVELVRYFGVEPDTIPRMRPYLSAEPERVARWRRLIEPGVLNVGIAWQGSRENKSDRHRSLPLSVFDPLSELDGVRLISLQIGDGSELVQSVAFADRITLPGEDFDKGPDALLDAAALCASLDLVVCCDSSVGHLAGAIGCPVFLALPAVADWRWLATGDLTNWYPETRLFRQRLPGEWRDVMRRIADATASMAQSARSGREEA